MKSLHVMMKNRSFQFALMVAWSALAVFAHPTLAQDKNPASPATAEEKVSYYQNIRPIFQAECHGCHQPSKAKGGYVMTAFDKLLQGGDSEETAVVPGEPDASLLLTLITPVDGEAEMPQKGGPLAANEIELVRNWIAQGAVDDTPPNARIQYDMEHPPVYTLPPIVTSLDFSPDGRWLAVAGYHEVLIHHADGSGLAARLVGLSARVESVRFSPDGAKLAVTGGLPARMGEVQIWDAEKWELDSSVPVTYDTVYGASWSPDGTLVAFGCSDTTVRAIEAKTGTEVLFNSAHDDWPLDTVFSTNGNHVISVGRDMATKLFELETQRFIDNITSITPGALKGGLAAVARHPFKDEVLVGGSDGVPQIYRVFREVKRVIGDNSNLIRRFPAMEGRIFGVDYSPDGQRIVAGSSLNGEGHVHIYSSVFDSTITEELKKIFEKVVTSRSAEENKLVEEFHTRDVKLLAEMALDTAVYAVAWHPQNDQIAVAGADGIIRLLDARTASLRKVFLSAPMPEADGQKIIALTVDPPAVRLNGKFQYSQMVVTGWKMSGDKVDLTRQAKARVASDVAAVSAAGMVEPLKNGQTQLIVSYENVHAKVPVEVSGQDDPFHPNFVRDVNPVISKMGCNAGTCHGAKDGKNGFKLSLRGYDPEFDVRAFADDLAGRRVNFASPDDSLMLLKATAAVPHEGGQRTKPDSDYYQILRDWIAHGCELETDVAKVKSIEILPENPVVERIGDEQQMRVVATYTDGTRRDVTAEAFVESGNTDVATAADPALVKSVRRGEAPLLARFEGAYAATTLTVMGDRSGFEWEEPPKFNHIDELVAAKWKRMKILPSELCTDEEFIRRAHLDLTGLPPTVEDVRAFLDDSRPTQEKRNEVIERLVGSNDYVDYWANKWADLLQVNRKFLGSEGAAAFRDWIREQVKENVPYNEFSYDILTASGSNRENPAASYYKILRTPEDTMENTTHLFLATRFNCNKCHDHPFERWTQDQYYEMSAFFARVDFKKDPESGDKRIGGTAVEGSKPLYEIVYDKDEGEVKHERTGAVTPPDFPYPTEFKAGENASRRERLASWITSADNDYFARSYVNRVWGYLTGTGLIEPLDDIRAGNPPSNPELLDWLTTRFVESGFDVQQLIKTICQSRTYQLSIKTHRWNVDDTVNFSHAKPRRLPAEVLYDTLYRALGAKSHFPGVPEGTRAAALPDVGVKLPDGFLGTLGRPARESACECERSNDLQLGSVMALVTGPTVDQAISSPDNAIAELVEERKNNEEVVKELYLRILNRPATDREVDVTLAAFEDIEPDHEKLLAELERYKKELEPVLADRAATREKDIADAKAELAAYEQEIAPREAELDQKQTEAIAKAEQELETYEADLPEQLQAWESTEDHETRWVALNPSMLRTSNKSKLDREADGAIFASGDKGKVDYTIVADTALPQITAVKLELLTDKRLPKNGPGRAGDGNFVVTEFELSRAAVGDAELVEEWSFEDNDGGWKQLNACELAVENGALKVTSTGGDPFFGRTLETDAGPFVLELRVRAEKGLPAQLFWASEDEPGFAEERSAILEWPATGSDWVTQRFYFESKSGLRNLRLDPGTEKGEVLVDSIRLLRGREPKLTKVALQNAKADFSQEGFNVTTAIDGKKPDDNNGWASHPKLGVRRVATFELKKPIQGEEASTLSFTINQSYKGNEFSLGKFRLWATASDQPVDFGVPENIGAILDIASEERTDEQKESLLAFFRAQDDELKKKQDQVAEAKKPRPIDPMLKELQEKLARVEQPLPPDPALTELERAVQLSTDQLETKRLTAAQDLAWALINNPAFLFNR